eukprot:3240961-Pyramimonas_sp.AAC.1
MAWPLPTLGPPHSTRLCQSAFVIARYCTWSSRRKMQYLSRRRRAGGGAHWATRDKTDRARDLYKHAETSEELPWAPGAHERGMYLSAGLIQGPSGITAGPRSMPR